MLWLIGNSMDGKKMTVGVGSVIVAEPYAGDAYFDRAAVLVTEHGEAGSVGFILNKPLSVDVADLVDEFPARGFRLGVGGPIQPQTLHFIHRFGEIIPGATHLYDNLYWGGDFTVLCCLIGAGVATSSDVRFFLGYSSWCAGQLADEMNREVWGVAGASEQIILGDTRGLWYDLVSRMPEYTHWLFAPLHAEAN